MYEEFKISFLGDIMCEKPLQHYYEKEKNRAFADVFIELQPLLKKSDYVIGNLETVFAGEECGYTDHIYRFNSPDYFCEAIRDGYINMVTTASNHSLDRGIPGLMRTLDVLDKCGIEHTGTFRSPEEQKQIFTKQFGSTKIAILSYCYGTIVNDINNFTKQMSIRMTASRLVR